MSSPDSPPASAAVAATAGVSSASAGRRQRSPGWYYPLYYVGAFLVVVAANATLIFSAMNSWPGLTTEHAYDEGVKYNLALAGARSQVERGWQVTIAYTDQGRGKGALEVTILDRQGRPLNDCAAKLRLIRPTHKGVDRDLAVTAAGNGRYVAAVDVPLPGLWDVRLVASNAEGDYQTVQRIEVSE